MLDGDQIIWYKNGFWRLTRLSDRILNNNLQKKFNSNQ